VRERTNGHGRATSTDRKDDVPHSTLLDELDPSGAIEEAAVAAGATRRELLRYGAAGAGLAAGSGLFATALAEGQGARPTRARDIRILRFALQLERLGASFYLETLNNRTLPRTSQELLFAVTVRRDELDHVRAVRTAIRFYGGRAPQRPDFEFGLRTQDIAQFRETAFLIEDLCVGALNGAGPLVTRTTLALAARMVSVEARQAAWIADIIGQVPAPNAFDPAIPAAQVAATVRGAGFADVRVPRL
jgi:hypothetical protein